MKYLVSAGVIISGMVLIATSGSGLSPGIEREQRACDSPRQRLPSSLPNVPGASYPDSTPGRLEQVAVAGGDAWPTTIVAVRAVAPTPTNEAVETIEGLLPAVVVAAAGEPIGDVLASAISARQPTTQVRQLDHGGPGGEPLPSVPTLTHFGLLGDGEFFFFTVEGPAGARYFLETSKDLQTWTQSEGATTGAANPPSGFVDKGQVGDRFFVRVRLP